MRIDIWSDVVCPWCYIGKRRIEKAIEGRDDVEVVYHSFQLDPSTPQGSTQTVTEHLAEKYGARGADLQQMMDRVEAVAAEEGLLFRHAHAPVANTLDAHRLIHLALDQGGPALQGRFKEALLAAYFLRAENPGDHDTLTRIADETGLDADRTRAVLAGDEFADAVEADVRQAVAYGANGVPFFVIDNRYGVSGAQPVEVFADVIAKADVDARPLVSVVGTDTDEACGPDGCAI